MSESQPTKPKTRADGPQPTTVAADTELGATLPFAPSPLEGGPGQIGKYRILGLLGVGGMGAVYHAQDTMLQRYVAIKLLRPELNDQATARLRFLREAQAVAALTHDHIIAIHEVNEQDGLPFLVMPLLDGETLHARLAREPRLPIPLALRFASEIAEALTAAHRAGIIHRDIKPANIFLEQHNGRDRVKLLDFGLARPIESAAAVTREGAIIGTPAYMAPEQARGHVDARSDLFSLGCVLYEMTTGCRAFVGRDALAIITAIMTDEPTPPREHNAAIPNQLAKLIQILLRKKPEERPASAAEVVDLLNRQNDEPASPSPRHRQRWMAAFFLFLTAVVVFIVYAVGRRGESTITERSLPRPDLTLPPLPERERFAWQPKELVAVIGEHRHRHWGPVTGLALRSRLASCASGDAHVRIWDGVTLDLLETLPLPHPQAACLAFSTNERWLACGLENGVVVIWDRSQPLAPPLTCAFPEVRVCTSLAFSIDENLLFVGDHAGYMARVDLSMRPLKLVVFSMEKINRPITCMDTARDGRSLAAGNAEGRVTLWDYTPRIPVRINDWQAHPKVVNTLVFSRETTHLWTGGHEDQLVRRWKLSDKPDLNPLTLQPDGQHEATFGSEIQSLSLAGPHEVLVVNDGRNLGIWEGTNLQPRFLCKENERRQRPTRAVLSEDGLHLYIGDEFGCIRVRTRTGDAFPVTLDATPQAKAAFAVAPATGALATIWGDCSVRLFHLKEGGFQQFWTSKPKEKLPYGVAFNEAGTLLVVGTDDESGIELWSVEGDRVRLLDSIPVAACRALVMSPQGDFIVVATEKPSLMRVEIAQNKLKPPVPYEVKLRGGVNCLRYASSGHRLIGGGSDGNIQVWDVQGTTLKPIRSSGAKGTLQTLAIAEDGTRFASASRWGGIRLTELDGQRMERELSSEDAHCVAFDHAGDRIAGSLINGTLIVWDARTRTELTQWRFPGAILDLAFSPDGAILYTLNGNGTIYALKVK